MENKKIVKLNDDMLDQVSGGSFGFDPDSMGTYTMRCQYTGQTFYGVKLQDIIEMGKYGATIDDNLDGEIQIIAWAKAQGYIH